MIDRSLALDFIGDQRIALVEKQDAELLAGFIGHGRMAIIDHGRPGRENLLFTKLAAQNPLADRRNQFQIERDALADPLDLLQQACRGAKHACKRTETGQ
ncbi:hypothetical protein D3C87_1851680 [compost metagenome]